MYFIFQSFSRDSLRKIIDYWNIQTFSETQSSFSGDFNFLKCSTQKVNQILIILHRIIIRAYQKTVKLTTFESTNIETLKTN